MAVGNTTRTMLREVDRRLEAVRTLDPAAIGAPGERGVEKLRDLVVGGFLRYDGEVYRVEEVSTYQETDERYEAPYGAPWKEYKLFGVTSGATAYLEWEEDDEVEVFATRTELRFRDLRDDAGAPVDEDDLEEIVDVEDVLVADGRTFEYDDDYPALYRRGGEGAGEGVYLYEFEADDGAILSVEEWVDTTGRGREEYQVWLTEAWDPRALEILSTGTVAR